VNPAVHQVDGRRLGARLGGRKPSKGAVWPGGDLQEQRRAQVGVGQQAQVAPGAGGACACQQLASLGRDRYRQEASTGLRGRLGRQATPVGRYTASVPCRRFAATGACPLASSTSLNTSDSSSPPPGGAELEQREPRDLNQQHRRRVDLTALATRNGSRIDQPCQRSPGSFRPPMRAEAGLPSGPGPASDPGLTRPAGGRVAALPGTALTRTRRAAEAAGMAQKATDTSRGSRPWLAGGPAMGMASRAPCCAALPTSGLAAGRLGLHPQTGESFRPGLCLLGNGPPGLLRRGIQARQPARDPGDSAGFTGLRWPVSIQEQA
jgi:hypothetical protein